MANRLKKIIRELSDDVKVGVGVLKHRAHRKIGGGKSTATIPLARQRKTERELGAEDSTVTRSPQKKRKKKPKKSLIRQLMTGDLDREL